METNDDQLIADTISECLYAMSGLNTYDNMTVCYNLTARVLRLFCVQGEKKDILALIDKFSAGLKEQIEETFLE